MRTLVRRCEDADAYSANMAPIYEWLEGWKGKLGALTWKWRAEDPLNLAAYCGTMCDSRD